MTRKNTENAKINVRTFTAGVVEFVRTEVRNKSIVFDKKKKFNKEKLKREFVHID